MTDDATPPVLNTFGEIVCEHTGIVAYGCSHCAGLPWGEDPDDA